MWPWIRKYLFNHFRLVSTGKDFLLLVPWAEGITPRISVILGWNLFLVVAEFVVRSKVCVLVTRVQGGMDPISYLGD